MDDLKSRRGFIAGTAASFGLLAGCTESTNSSSGTSNTNTSDSADDETSGQTEQEPGSQTGSMEGSWTTFQYDSNRSGFAPSEEGPEPIADATTAWTHGVSTRTYPPSCPIVNGTQVFVTTYGGSVRALDLATGEQQWRFEVPSDVYATPTVDDGTVYVGSTDRNLYAINSETGEENWSYRTGFPVNQPVATDEEYVYFTGATGPKGGFVEKLTKDGKQEWRHDMTQYSSYGNDVEAGPSLGESHVFIGSGRKTQSSTFVAISKSSGNVDWTFETDEYEIDADTYQTATVVEDVVYAPLGGPDISPGHLYAFNTQDGSLIWEYETEQGHTLNKACAATNDAVYILEEPANGSNDSTLRKLNAEGGSTEWQATLSTSDPRCTPSIVSDSVYVGTLQVDRDSGEKYGAVGGEPSFSESCVTQGNLITHGGGGYKLWRTE